MTRSFKLVAAAVAALLLAPAVQAEDPLQNHFASILVDGKKAGQVHFTVKHTPEGNVEELHTNVSISVLGIELYHYVQQLHERWAGGGALASFESDTTDNGKKITATAEGTDEGYKGEVNGDPVTLPAEAFPASLWHFAITQQSLLFHLEDLRLMKVEVAAAADTVERGGASVPATKYTFSGEWSGTIWFDAENQFMKATYESDGHDIMIELD